MNTDMGNQNYLHIDTSSNIEVTVGLIVRGKRKNKTKKYGANRDQIVLPLIETLLSENDLSLWDVRGISVNPGPGSFTGLRIGISIANALGYYLQIPVNGKIGYLVEPEYT